MTAATLGKVTASINRALWGEVSARLRCVQFKPDKSRITLRFSFDSAPNDSDLESVSCVGAEVAADFPKLAVVEEVATTDAGSVSPQQDGWHTAFARKEPSLVR